MSEALYRAVKTGRVKIEDLNDDGKRALKEYMTQKPAYEPPTTTPEPVKAPSILDKAKSLISEPKPIEVWEPKRDKAEDKKIILSPKEPAPVLPPNPQGVDKTGRGRVTPAMRENIREAYPASLAAFSDSVLYGVGKRSDPEYYQSKKEESPIAYGAGNLAGQVAKYLGAGAIAPAIPGISKIASPFLQAQATDLLVDNIAQTPQTIAEGIKENKSAGEIGKDLLKQNAVDVAFNLAIGGLGEAIKAIKKGRLQKIELPTEAVSEVATGPKYTGKYTTKNTALEKATNEYNQAIEVIQNHFKTNELNPEEIGLIKSELGIDLDKLVDNLTKAEKKINLPELGQKGQLAIKAGVVEPPTLKPKLENNTIKPLLNVQEPTESVLKGINNNGGSKPLPDINKPLTEATGGLKETAATTAEAVAKVGTESPSAIIKQLDLIDEPLVKASSNTGVENYATNLKDSSGFQLYTTDVYRNFEQVFGDKFPEVKKAILDPFDDAKKSKVLMDQEWLGKLKTEVVDRLNIGKETKESELVQKFGEKLITLDELKKAAPQKWQDIVEADKWFRNAYDNLIDKINISRAKIYNNNVEKLIPKRQDYYRHFQDLSDTFAGARNLFETPSQINPQLAGLSEYTKPKSKWLSIAQRRTGNKTEYDAIGGFIDYMNAASFATHIDPQIPNFRALAKDLANATEETANVNNFIGYLTEFTNDLAGKTNKFDRAFQDVVPGGRNTMRFINWVNSRVKANTVLGNLSSSMSQIANVPQGIAYVKNPAQLTKGAGNYMASIFGQGDADLYKQSGFLLERYSDDIVSQFNTRLIDQPKKLAAWLLGALDEVGTKFIWSSTYQKALSENMPNPIKYADDITRKMVAGRGIGEVPIMQKSKLFQLVAPFTVEVNNLWKVQKDFIKGKDFGGLLMLYVANFALNKGMEKVRGSGVTFDPIEALGDALSTFKDEDLSVKDKALNVAGRLGGEVMSNMPLGSTLANQFPEETRKKYFGDYDPTRFGSGLVVSRGLQDPLFKLLPSFGGGQLKKTLEGAKELNLLPNMKNKVTGSYIDSADGKKLRTPIDPKPTTLAQGLAFGKGAIPELREYYKNPKSLTVKQTDAFERLVSQGIDAKLMHDIALDLKGKTKKEDQMEVLKKYLRQNKISLPQLEKIKNIYIEEKNIKNPFDENRSKNK